MEDLNQIIESLRVNYDSRISYSVLSSVQIEEFPATNNMLIRIDKGKVYFGVEKDLAVPGTFIFIPAGRSVRMYFGKVDSPKVHFDDLFSPKGKLAKEVAEPTDECVAGFTIMTFSAKIFDALEFFNTLKIPAFLIERSEEINTILKQVLTEELTNEVYGKEKMLKLLSEKASIEILRYIVKHNLFMEQMVTNTAYYKDPRLIDIFKYIQENLAGDLSNKVLADVASISDDYVGQYFKMLTGINPQDYVEYQRMQYAIDLLRTTKMSIRDLSRKIGYKDTAYFCRRFKMMFGIPAAKMRKRDSLINAMKYSI